MNPPARESSRRCSSPRRPRACSPARSPKAHRPHRSTTATGVERVADSRPRQAGNRRRPTRTGWTTCRSPRSSPRRKQVFDEVPVRNPGTLAFVPIVDGDLLHDYPVRLAQEGRSHPVPLIIGTNKHEAALFRLMRSPLMPITPHAITSMFTQIAAEQPDLQLPTEEQIVSAYSRNAAQGKAFEHCHRRRVPDAVGLAGRGAQQGGARLSVPVRLRDSVAEGSAGQRRPRHRITLRVGQSRGTQGPHIEARRRQNRQGGLKEDADQVDQLRYAGQAHGPAR